MNDTYALGLVYLKLANLLSDMQLEGMLDNNKIES